MDSRIVTLATTRLERLVKVLDSQDDTEPLASGISTFNALIGEDLCISAFLQYQNKKGRKANEINFPFKPKGHRQKLDAWIQVEGCLYQTEIKNWSSFSLGGIPTSLAPDDAKRNAHRVWKNQYEYCINSSNARDQSHINKVFAQYDLPGDFAKADPLLLVWDPASANANTIDEPESVYQSQFGPLRVFSVSLYARQLIHEGCSLQLTLKRSDKKFTLISWLLEDS